MWRGAENEGCRTFRRHTYMYSIKTTSKSAHDTLPQYWEGLSGFIDAQSLCICRYREFSVHSPTSGYCTCALPFTILVPEHATDGTLSGVAWPRYSWNSYLVLKVKYGSSLGLPQTRMARSEACKPPCAKRIQSIQMWQTGVLGENIWIASLVPRPSRPSVCRLQY